ncbi:MAG: twin-arginine translocase TatA/TatE family subunit [Verrucomicrobiae bacterium]|nr:twin-arginine translocase TatA/TatE family subunit [Verrucomicrobiae bacterium]
MNTIVLGMLGGWEIAGIVVVVLVLFGARKVPELMKGLGHGIKEFKKASREVQDEVERAMEEEPVRPTKPAKPAAKTETVASSSDTKA